MERDALTTPGSASPPDPPQDQPSSTVPELIGCVLYAVRVLLGYGRRLLGTIEYRAASPTFSTFAARFGTANLSTILAHLNRGILRATALERVLLARAATGRDIEFIERRADAADTQPAPADTPAAQPPAPKPTRRRSLPIGGNDPELFIPTLEELERQVRRRTVGRTITDICLDLAVVPDFCTAPFWNHLFEIMHYFGGSVVAVMKQKTNHEQRFIREQDHNRDTTWNWLRMNRDTIRQILGCFIGEEPDDPLTPAAALATGPP